MEYHLMTKIRNWTDEQLIHAVKNAYSIRQVIIQLGLIPAGGNYVQINNAINRLEIDITHFTGSRWNKGKRYILPHVRKKLDDLLVINSNIQSFKLKKRLFEVGVKLPQCEMCGWREVSKDGRIPVELDHINGDRKDNRLQNLRILCPNCHSLQPTHRGRNKMGFTRNR